MSETHPSTKYFLFSKPTKCIKRGLTISKTSLSQRFLPLSHASAGGVALKLFSDAGQDEPEAEGNDDGHPTKNNVFKNKIWSDSDEAIRMTNADGNDIYVSKPGHSLTLAELQTISHTTSCSKQPVSKTVGGVPKR